MSTAPSPLCLSFPQLLSSFLSEIHDLFLIIVTYTQREAYVCVFIYRNYRIHLALLICTSIQG